MFYVIIQTHVWEAIYGPFETVQEALEEKSRLIDSYPHVVARVVAEIA